MSQTAACQLALQVLSYHILPGLVPTSQMEDAQKLPTLLTEAVVLNQTYSQRGGKGMHDDAREASLLVVSRCACVTPPVPWR